MKKTLILIAVTIVGIIAFAFVWYLISPEKSIDDVFTPAPQKEFNSPIQINEGKG